MTITSEKLLRLRAGITGEGLGLRYGGRGQWAVEEMREHASDLQGSHRGGTEHRGADSEDTSLQLPDRPNRVLQGEAWGHKHS